LASVVGHGILSVAEGIVRRKRMDLAVWRDISLLWLIFLTFLTVLPVGVLLFFVIKGLHGLRKVARRYLPMAQSGAQRVSDTADRLSGKITAPVISLRAKVAQVDRLRIAAFRRKQA
jgi:hypothetical protein